MYLYTKAYAIMTAKLPCFSNPQQRATSEECGATSPCLPHQPFRVAQAVPGSLWHLSNRHVLTAFDVTQCHL